MSARRGRPHRILCALACLAGVGWVAGPGARSAQAQSMERFCLPDNSATVGIDVEVASDGVIHISRVARFTGDLVHTTLDAAGESVDRVVVERMSVFADDDTDDIGLALMDDRPAFCFRHAYRDALEVAVPIGEREWAIETVDEDADAGRECELVRGVDGRLGVAYTRGGELWWADRNGPDAWATGRVDRAGGRTVGRTLDAVVAASGRVLLAHQDTDRSQLRIAWRDPAGAWQRRAIADDGLDVGWAPSIVTAEPGWVWIAHAVTPPDPTDGTSSDLGWMVTFGFLDDPLGLDMGLDTVRIDQEETAGALAATRTGGGYTVFARLQRRNLVFGVQDDALRMYPNLPADDAFDTLEQHGRAAARHTFTRFAAATDPFDLPVLVMVDRTGAYMGAPSVVEVCGYRPADADGDGLPDDAEAVYGTRPDDPDSDADGRWDGVEVLVDGTNPLGGGEVPVWDVVDADIPLPIPDAAIDAEVDAAVDAEVDAAIDAEVDAEIDAVVVAPRDAMPSEPDVRVDLVDAAVVPPVDAEAVLPVDAAAVLPVDAEAMLPVDAEAMLPVDAEAMLPVDAEAMLPVDADSPATDAMAVRADGEVPADVGGDAVQPPRDASAPDALRDGGMVVFDATPMPGQVDAFTLPEDEPEEALADAETVGCACDSTRGPASTWLLAFLLAMPRRRRRQT